MAHSERGHFCSPETKFDLKVGVDYPILGIGLFETVLLVLVCDESGLPNGLPIGLFEFGLQTFPSDWKFVLLNGVAASGGVAINRWVARWGYPHLIEHLDHSDGLVERDPEALQNFYRELDKQQL